MPSNTIGIIETDCQVDFAPSLDYKESEKPAVPGPRKALVQAEETAAETEPKFNHLTGVGRHLDVKPAKVEPSPASSWESKDKQPAVAAIGGQSAGESSAQSANHQSQGKLVFGSSANRAPKDDQKEPAKESKKEEPQKEEPKYQSFLGKKCSLRD